MTTLTFLRVLIGGYVAMARRALRGRPCPCPFCRDHRAFIREQRRAEAGRGLRADYVVLDEAHVFVNGEPVPALVSLPTLAEVRDRRHP